MRVSERVISALLRAASAYSAPVSQFMDNAYFQGLYYTVLAATDGLKIIGAIVQCTIDVQHEPYPEFVIEDARPAGGRSGSPRGRQTA